MQEPIAREAPTGKLFDGSPITINQIVDKTGVPYQAVSTENIWVGGYNVFSSPRYGNQVTPFTTGEAYFEDLWASVMGASHSVYITGWQVNWDAELKPGLRLFNLLLLAVQKNPQLKVYVMPWKHSPPIQTYDGQTKSVLEAINDLAGRKCVWVTLASSLADEDSGFFSHHQKTVIVDEKIGYVGGMDLCYGRFDDARYSLIANDKGREALNRYNGCVKHVGQVSKDKVVDPDLLTGAYDDHPTFGGLISSNHSDVIAKIQAGAFQVAYGDETPYWSRVRRPAGLQLDYSTLNEKTQPRMPWQDVHLRVDGPSASDVARNFVMRWNSEGGTEVLPLPQTPAPDANLDKCGVQVLRSAPLGMRKAEYEKLDPAAKKGVAAPGLKQCDIAIAMRNLIAKSMSFIYIENQFFVSGFGSAQTDPDSLAPNIPSEGPLSGPAEKIKGFGTGEKSTHAISTHPDEAPKNFICELLGERIGKAIMAGPKQHFHVIITLPVHPEGTLDNENIVAQVHWTMQSLVFGSFSLLNRIRRFLKARALKDKKDPTWQKVLSDAKDVRYKDIDISACDEYVTLLNLRNWAKVGDRYITEQIYIHTKMMIVDDLFALVGSANINDRSMLGSRDSEIAMLVSDTATHRHDIEGTGSVKVTRDFARKLRRDVWSKIFGITGGVRPASSLQIAIDQPGNPASWKAIQTVANKNRDLYEAAFDFIPRNRTVTGPASSEPASIWPRWDTVNRRQNGPMPFDAAFWTGPQHTKGAAEKLSDVQGYIVTLPIEWTKGENNNVGFPTSLVAENTVPQKADGISQKPIALNNDADNSKGEVS
ncbi:phospholipase D-like domain-containing protein [Paraburkholderia sediminicola]|uniref:phospholipase D-like domain-containing protein n=1 Tax=Paraburkholderia sediminicola TaxID=458836 RepID=UPI0038B9F67F